MIITNSRYALVSYFITSYPTRAHGIIVNYYEGQVNHITCITLLANERIFVGDVQNDRKSVRINSVLIDKMTPKRK